MQPPLRNLLIFLGLMGLSLLGIGAVQAQYRFQTRGIPAGFVPPIPHGQAEIGLVVQLHQYNDAELTSNLNEIAALGITTIKHSIFYAGNDPVPWEAYDRIISASHAAGLQFVPLLDGSPATNFAPPLDLDHFTAWVADFAGRYADQLTAYIIWDEPNLASHWGNQPPNPTDYAALLTSSANAVRSADPDAVIVAAPLAPTTETGPQNLNEALFLEELYAAGAADAFDVVAVKPYGFDTGPEDRRVDQNVLNFSRAILVREVLEQHGEPQKAVWAGNWGWNSLPADWQGQPSIWGQTSAEQQAEHTLAAWERARQEWPWMGVMFLENWEPDAEQDDPIWGFSITGRSTASVISTTLNHLSPAAYPGFHPAGPEQPGQIYTGTWRFSPEFGADIGQTGDTVAFRFWGSDLALRVRRADYRARLHITVDGEPANALPKDETGAALVLTAADPADDFIDTVAVAQGLPPGEHTAVITAARGWEQWALQGFNPAYFPSATPYRIIQFLLAALAIGLAWLALRSARKVNWPQFEANSRRLGERLGATGHLLLTTLAAVVVGLSGYLTWGGETAGLYRRLGDAGQIALTAAAASVFYVTPSFLVYVAALLVLFLLIYARPAWGMAIIAFSFPLYVLPKPILGYRFSPVEIFLLVTVAATGLRLLVDYLYRANQGHRPAGNWLHMFWQKLWRQSGKADLAALALILVATLSLLFTERLDVALNEWRVVIVEPVLFYSLWRVQRLRQKEVWVILDAFILSGVVVASYGLVSYLVGENVITVAGGLARLRSFYGSPNNVALYLGRLLPFLGAMLLLGSQRNGLRRWLYSAALLPVGVALLLTFSKGAFFLGLPITALILIVLWRRNAGSKAWPWVVGMGLLGVITLAVFFTFPAVSTRLNPGGYTSFLRLNLWQSSLNMIIDHPLTGVGLDNFLYEYRGRYILDNAWQEPDLNHPHNLFLDFWTRLGIFGLITGIWLFVAWGRHLFRLTRDAFFAPNGALSLPPQWLPVIAGLAAAFGQTVAHGLVDHSFFLVDLAFTFFLFLGLSLWLTGRNQQTAL